LRLDELVKSVENMSLEELQALVRDIRADRQVSKRAQRTSSTKTRAKKSEGAKALLAAMTPEQRMQLLARLAGGKK